MITLSEQKIRDLIRVKKKNPHRKVLYGVCPQCGHDEFGISLKEGNPFGCFRKSKCGFTGNAYSLLRFLGVSFKKEVKFQEKLDKPDFQIKSLMEFQLPERKMPAGFRRIYQDDYLDSRGFKPKDYEKNYLVGRTGLVEKFKGYKIIGIKQYGKTTGYIGRSTLSKQQCEEQGVLRYRNSTDDFSKMLDGLNESDYQEATIVEGVFDRVNVRNIFETFSIRSRVLCSFGSKFSNEQALLLKKEKIKAVNLFFDPDVIKTFDAVGSMLLNDFEEVNVILSPQKEKDPGDMNEEEVLEAYKNRQSFIKFENQKLKTPKL